jgi:outer membrane protein TolC
MNTLRFSFLIFGLILSASSPCFADSLSIPADQTPLSFEDALSQIIGRSTALATQNANLGVAQANKLPAQFAFAPSLSLDAVETWTGNKSYTLSSSLVEGVAKLNLVHWGADIAQLKAAGLDEESQKSTVNATLLKVEDDAIRALIGWIQRKREIEVNQGIVKTQSELLKIAQQRFNGGYLPLQEVNKISVDLDNASASLADAEVRAIEARAAVENLLGHSSVAENWPWRERIIATNLKSIAGPKLDLSQRPDWLAAQAKRDAEEERYNRNMRLLLPSVDSSLAFGNYTNPGATFGLPGTGSLSWTGTISMTLPFFDHLVSYTNVRTQLYARSAAEATLTQVERDALSDWEAAQRSFKATLETALARDKTLSASHKIYEDNLRRFQAGRISANDLALDQRRVFDSELFAVQGWSAAHLAYSRLCHSVGRRVHDCK